MFCVFVGEGQKPGGDQGPDGEYDGVGGDINRVNPPVQPHWDGGHYERVPVEQGAGLGGVVLAESLQQQLLLSGHLPCFGRHLCALCVMISVKVKSLRLHNIRVMFWS